MDEIYITHFYTHIHSKTWPTTSMLLRTLTRGIINSIDTNLPVWLYRLVNNLWLFVFLSATPSDWLWNYGCLFQINNQYFDAFSRNLYSRKIFMHTVSNNYNNLFMFYSNFSTYHILQVECSFKVNHKDTLRTVTATCSTNFCIKC
jgi:hypothetical protein